MLIFLSSAERTLSKKANTFQLKVAIGDLPTLKRSLMATLWSVLRNSARSKHSLAEILRANHMHIQAIQFWTCRKYLFEPRNRVVLNHVRKLTGGVIWRHCWKQPSTSSLAIKSVRSWLARNSRNSWQQTKKSSQDEASLELLKLWYLKLKFSATLNGFCGDLPNYKPP